MKTKPTKMTLGMIFMVIYAFSTLHASAWSVSRTWEGGSSMLGGKAEAKAWDETTADSQTINGTITLWAEALKSKVKAAEAKAALTVTKTGTGRAIAVVDVVGKKLVNLDETFKTKRDFKTKPLVKDFSLGVDTFRLGPATFKVRAGASMSVWLEGTGDVKPGVLFPQVEGNVGPVCDAAATASASVSIIVASAGVAANATLVRAGLKPYAKLYSNATQGLFDYGVNYSSQKTNGAISLFVKVKTWLFNRKWNWDIVRFNSKEETGSLYAKTAVLW